MTPQVAVIILNWNGWADTIECLESLYQNNYDNYNVLVVDNASDDDSLQKIREYCQGKIRISSKFFTYKKDNKPIKIFEAKADKSEHAKIPDNCLILIKNNNNQGFAQGNNTGIRFAHQNLNPEYFLLLNNDTVVDPEFLTEMVKTGQSDEKIGFVGPKTYLYDDESILQSAGGGFIDFTRGESHEVAYMEEDKGDYDIYLELEYVGGSCLLVKKKVIEKIGLLDENYFMYWEDVDWCLSGKKAGYKSVYSFKSKIWHKYGASSKNYFKTYYHNRNRIYLTKKQADKRVYREFLGNYLLEIIRECGYQLFYRRDWNMFKSLFKGTIDGLRMNTNPK